MSCLPPGERAVLFTLSTIPGAYVPGIFRTFSDTQFQNAAEKYVYKRDGITSVVTLVIYKPLSPILKNAHMLSGRYPITRRQMLCSKRSTWGHMTQGKEKLRRKRRIQWKRELQQ